MICRRCSNNIKNIDRYCRNCGLKTYNDIPKTDMNFAQQMNKLNIKEETKEKDENKLLVIGISAIIVLILIITILIYTIVKNS